MLIVYFFSRVGTIKQYAREHFCKGNRTLSFDLIPAHFLNENNATNLQHQHLGMQQEALRHFFQN